MKIITIYFSQTGNTEKIAKAINQSFEKDHEADLRELKDININMLDDYDLVFIGSPCHSSDLVKSIKSLLEEIPNNPKYNLVGFFTHACFPPELEEYKELYEKWVGNCRKTFERISSEKNIKFHGCFRCLGAPSAPIEQFIHQEIVTDEKIFKEYLAYVKPHPDEKDIQDAQKFALDVIQKVA